MKATIQAREDLWDCREQTSAIPAEAEPRMRAYIVKIGLAATACRKPTMAVFKPQRRKHSSGHEKYADVGLLAQDEGVCSDNPGDMLGTRVLTGTGVVLASKSRGFDSTGTLKE